MYKNTKCVFQFPWKTLRTPGPHLEQTFQEQGTKNNTIKLLLLFLKN